MNRILLFVTVYSVVLLAGCGSNEVRTGKAYTHKEFTKMTYCIGMTDTAMHAATSKLKGIPMEQITSQYATREGFHMNIATVEKVYSENFSSVWEYSISFFEGCALNLAQVEASRIGKASHCAQNSLIAGLAYTYRSLGTSKEKTYEHFAVFENKESNIIVDEVYESRYSRAEIKLDIWTSCMSIITSD